MLHHRSSGVLNITTGLSRSFREVAELVASFRGRYVEIQTTPRVNRITHRHFDISAHLRAFPTFMSLATGLSQMLGQHLQVE